MSHMSLHQTKIKSTRFKGNFMWNGRIGVVTSFMLDLPWKLSWQMRSYRMKVYITEHVLSVILLSHISTCLWYSMHVPQSDMKEWHKLGYPEHPASEKLLTSFLMLFGCVFLRYQFIGNLTWEMVLKQRRWFTFVDRYHHMINYLKLRGASATLTEQTERYKTQLWKMKDDEAFMRQVSLLMRHEIYLSGQQIWCQGVVKGGMIWIKKGVVELLSDEDDESPMIAFKEGTVLRRTEFLRAMNENPVKLKGIRDKVESRLSNSKRRQEAITNYDKGDSRLIRTRYRPMKVFKEHLSGLEEEDSTFVDDSHLYYRDENNVRQRKFTTEYLELYKISENVTTMDEPTICLKSKFPWILEPNTDFTLMFDIAHFVMILYVCVMSPYLAIRTHEKSWEKVMTTVVFSGLLFNIYIQLTTAVVDKNTIKDTVKDIAEVKMANLGFYLDVLSIFPLHIFTDTLDPKRESILSQLVVMLPILQVWHIWSYLSKWEKNFNVSVRRSWMAQLIYWETKIFVTNDAKHEKPIITALDFGTSIFTGSGTSDLAPGIRDLIFVTLLLIAGSYLGCFYIAKVCSIYLLLTQRKLKFKESMRELFYFLSVNHVSSKIKARVKKFFCVQWYYNNAVSADEIFKDISPNLQQEILSVEMVDTLLCCTLFQESSHDFLQTVAANIKTIVLPDNEIVQHAGDIGRDMYILSKGHCNVINYKGVTVNNGGPGSKFGVFEMLYGLPKVYTVVTSTNCILLHLDYRTLVQCWSIFPDISHIVMTVLHDPVICEQAKLFENAKPLTGKLDVKTNRIAQEIKESFIVINDREEKTHYLKAFEQLGVMRLLRYIFLPICITPHGIFLKFWCTLRLVVAIYYILVVPYNISTKQHKYGNSYIWSDIFLYLDIVVMAYVAYYDERYLLVTHPLLTVTRYLKHAFVLDIISVFPFEQLSNIINEHSDTDLYRLNRILLVTRVLGAFSYWENDIMRINQAVVLFKFLPLVATVVNSATAFIFTSSCQPFLPPDSYYVLVNCSRTFVISGNTYEIKYAITEYVHTFYWVFELFVGCGCTPIVLSNKADVWLSMALQITGALYFAFMFGYIASTQSTASHALLEHTEQTSDLADFLYQQNVDPTITMKTLKYFEYVWKRTNGSNAQQICRGLNSALMEDTLVFMYERALREVPLFGRVERSFIRVITQHLHEMYFLKGDTVIQCKDVQNDIFIIYRGKVDVLSTYNEMITCMGPGGMFGNFTGQSTSCSEVAIYASRSLDLLVLPSQTFFNLVKYYPKIQEPLRKAFEVSKDYILPISMDVDSDDESTEDSDFDLQSQDSAIDSRSGSSRFEVPGQISLRSSHSNISQSKSAASVISYQSYMRLSNLFRPGTLLFQAFGYLTCIMATANYVLILYELVTLNDCYIIFWVQSAFDIYFYLKIYTYMHQGYLNKHGELILSHSKCRRRYFKHKLWVWTDVIANFPLELFGFCFSDQLKAMHYLRGTKLLRLKHIYDFYCKTAAELTNNLTTLQSMTTVFLVVLFIHTFTCIWLVTLIATSPYQFIRTLKMHLIDEDTPQQRWDYTTSLYLVISELTGTGGDEIHIGDIFPMAILVICLICGKMLAAIVVATSIQIAYSTKYALNSYEMKTEELIDLLKNQGLSDYQLKKFWKYVRQLWVNERGRQLPDLMMKTPYVLRCDLMTAMFGHHLRNCYLFAETGEPFLRQLTAALNYTVFFPGNYIVVAGDSEACMFWVASGAVSVVSVRADLTETTHETLSAGDAFGMLQGLNRGVSHYFSYRADTKV
ncbi:Potassium voltage-gated channel subfamily H member 6 [Papilio xuthus]|uniref:Potassium voltage-gated channel subfamily H member 6 n=1 Tax=Papilio xuthus TaxID=66420 RepID=A0A194QB84_PAPXU|nr:Potassium voltage-gated channel subfamily H member 6 [Papilio xuthus]